MKQAWRIVILSLVVGTTGHSIAQDTKVPVLANKVNASFSMDGNRITVTLGPITLPTGHYGDLGASMQYVFTVPRDFFLVGYEAKVYDKDGTPLPKNYLHHFLLIDLGKESLSCPGEVYFFAGAGMEMIPVQFPPGYGVELKHDTQVMAVVAFYHDVPPTQDVMASITMTVAPRGTRLQPLKAQHVGVNVGCYTKLSQRAKDETDEGIAIDPGVQIRSASITFPVDGCVKYAYPHGHDYLVLLTLENLSTHRTLLRTIPDVFPRGKLKGFSPRQVFSDPVGFSVNTRDKYEITMVYHRPLDVQTPQYGMGNYILYQTRGPCEGG